jgi:nucleotide-binding universal stress UspA family protein
MTQLLAKQRALNTDLIVVAKRDKSLMEELLTESISLQLAARSECDVLNVR